MSWRPWLAALGRRLAAAGGRAVSRARGAQLPVERRQARALLFGAVVFAAFVMLVVLPWSTLVDQHAQLSSATTQVNELQSENRALAAQARALSDPSVTAGLARQDYGLVEPGQRAYDILPPSGSAQSDVVAAGHVPLDQSPVVPGSRRSEELLEAGAVGPSTANATTGRGGRTLGTGHRSGHGGEAGGFVSRVVHTLEFWS